MSLKRLPKYPEPPFVAVNTSDRTCIVLDYDAAEDSVTLIPMQAKIVEVDDRNATNFRREFKATEYDVKEAAARYLSMPHVTGAAKAALQSIKEGTFMKKVAKKAAKAARKSEKQAGGAAAKKSGPGRKSKIDPNGKIVMLKKENPFRKGSFRHDRFEKAAKAKTVAAYFKSGGGNGFLNRAVRKGLLKIVK